jgi:hypothetical protein
MLSHVAWSFSEPPPASPSALVSAVVARYNANYKESFDADILTSPSPLSRFDATYTYGVQRPSGQWDEVRVVVRIDGGANPLTYADILWQLHRRAYENLKDQDHHFFEGLTRVPGVFYEQEVPVYEVELGS